MQTHLEFFNQLAPRWDSMRSPERLRQIERLLDRFKLTWQSAPSILDVGSGTGLLLPLLQAYAPAARIVGLDLAQDMLSRARDRAGSAALLQASGQHLPLVEASFKVVIYHAVLPHLLNPPAALAEAQRVLQPGGTLLIFHEISRAEVNAIHRQVGGAIAADHMPLPTELRGWLVQAGFTAIHLEDAPSHFLAAAQKE